MQVTAQNQWKILLVDDDAAVRRTLSRALQLDGHDVLEAPNGLHGLRALESEAVDLIITDVVMPDMEGLEFLRRVRKREPSPRVIVISGGGHVTTSPYLELADRLGADATLLKPISMAELRDTVQQVMLGT